MKSSIAAVVFSLLHSIVAIPIRSQERLHPRDISQPLQNILDNTHNSPAYTYPTDLTRDITAKPIHSHNDYWRDVPFYTALSFGCQSVEADVYLYNETLFVGHELFALTPDRTFDSLYIQPILSVLSRQNPPNQVARPSRRNGVFDTDSSQTLYLFVDVKTDGATTWPYIVRALDPLRRGGYLTTVNGTNVEQGAVTVIGTGETPLNLVQGVSNRDYFYDANAAVLNTTQSDLNSTISPIASADFASYIGPIKNRALNETQLATLRSHIATAKSKGIGVRYWDTPSYPISTRNAVWETLINEGVALINADDLKAAAGLTGPAGW